MSSEQTTDIRDQVSKRYGEIAESGGACCSPAENPQSPGGLLEHAAAIGYDKEDLATLPEGANLGLGCGSPTSLTLIEPGMTVLDLYSGGGYYAELLAYLVGPGGRVVAHNNTPYVTFAKAELADRYREGRLPNVEQLIAENNELELPEQRFDAVVMIKAYHDVYYVDPDNGWRAEYEVLPGKEKVVEELRRLDLDPELLQPGADDAFPADNDRSGDAFPDHRLHRAENGSVLSLGVDHAFLVMSRHVDDGLHEHERPVAECEQFLPIGIEIGDRPEGYA